MHTEHVGPELEVVAICSDFFDIRIYCPSIVEEDMELRFFAVHNKPFKERINCQNSSIPT